MEFIKSTLIKILSKGSVVLAFLLILPTFLYSAPKKKAKTKRVTIEYKYIAGANESLNYAKQTALQRAKLQAIADEFGTVISSTTTTRIENSQSDGSGHSDVQVQSLSSSDVRGEWIKTIGEPKFKTIVDDDLGFVITVKVTGEIRERKQAEIDLKTLCLRNGTGIECQATTFADGDDLNLLFKAPIDGYLAVYLTDYSDAFCLLPYQNQQESAMPIKKNREYIFFSAQKAPLAMQSVVDEYHLTCGSKEELNRIYIIFSPQPFTKAIDERGDGTLPRYLSLKDFQAWLSKARLYDESMTCTTIDITIKPQR